MRRLLQLGLVRRRGYHLVIEQVPPDAQAHHVIESIHKCAGVTPVNVVFETMDNRRLAFVDLAAVSVMPPWAMTRALTAANP